MWKHQNLWKSIFIVLVPNWKDFLCVIVWPAPSSFSKTQPKPLVSITVLWQVALLSKKMSGQLCPSALLTYGPHMLLSFQYPVFPVFSKPRLWPLSRVYACDPFQEYMPSIFNTMPLSFGFLIKYSELSISLFPAALATSTDFWHIVLPLPSYQTVLKIHSCFVCLFVFAKA